MASKIKICGLSTLASLATALGEGADYVGFVFFEPSPRHLTYEQARALGAAVEGRAMKVALSVDADDARFDAIMTALDPDVLQLHGAESPERVADIKARFGKPVMKAIKLRGPGDLGKANAYIDAADMLVYDAMPPEGSVLPGGNGIAFDWTLLAKGTTRQPFMLSGGLNAENVPNAISILHPAIVDVSSGVEVRPGVKDDRLITEFIRAARGADNQN